MSLLVRAVNMYCGLEKQNSSALHYISLWGFKTVDLQFSRCDCTGCYSPRESARILPLKFAVFFLLVTVKPFSEAKVDLNLSHSLTPHDFGR
jgi:hypothetical protein